MAKVTKVNRAQLMEKVMEIVRAHSNDPADELIIEGRAIMQIGEALKGCEPHEARAVLYAAAKLLDVA